MVAILLWVLRSSFFLVSMIWCGDLGVCHEVAVIRLWLCTALQHSQVRAVMGFGHAHSPCSIFGHEPG